MSKSDFIYCAQCYRPRSRKLDMPLSEYVYPNLLAVMNMLGPSRISRYAESHIGRLSHQNHPEFWDWRSPLSSHRLWGLWVHLGRTVEHQIYGPRKGWANLCPENKCSNHWFKFTYWNLDSAGLTWNGPLPRQTKETVTAPLSVLACHIGGPI